MYIKKYGEFIGESKIINQKLFDKIVDHINDYKSMVDRLNIEANKLPEDYYQDEVIEINGSTPEEVQLWMKKSELYDDIYRILNSDLLINKFIDYTEALKNEEYKKCAKIKKELLKTKITDDDEQSREMDKHQLNVFRQTLKNFNKKKNKDFFTEVDKISGKEGSFYNNKQDAINIIKTLQKQTNCRHTHKVIKVDDRNPLDYGKNGEKYYMDSNGYVYVSYYCTDCDKYLYTPPDKRFIKPFKGLIGYDENKHFSKPKDF